MKEKCFIKLTSYFRTFIEEIVDLLLLRRLAAITFGAASLLSLALLLLHCQGENFLHGRRDGSAPHFRLRQPDALLVLVAAETEGLRR